MTSQMWTQSEVEVLLDTGPSGYLRWLPWKERTLSATKKKYSNWKACEKAGWSKRKYIESHPK